MTGPCPKRKLAAVSTIVYGQIRQRAEDGGRGPTKVLKTSHDIQHCNDDSAGTSTGALPSRQTSALAMLSKVHHPESCPPQFLYLRPGAGKLVWVAVLLFRGRYWTSDIHANKQDARAQVAEHAVEWLYSNDLEPSNTNPSLKSQDPERKGLWELELDWTELKKQSIPILLPQWTTKSVPEPFLAFFGEPMKKETTLAKVADTDILLPECTWFFPYRAAESQKPPSSTNNTTLPSYLRVSAAFRFHKKRAAALEPKSSVPDTSSSTARQSLPSALDTQAQKEYAPCASDMQLVKYTSGPRIIVLWAVLHIPVMIPRALHVYTPCPPDKQLVKYTPISSLEMLCVVRHSLTKSPVRTDAVEDGTTDNEAMDIEGSSTIYMEPANGGGESQVQQCAQYMSQDRFGTLAASSETSDMDMEQSEPESVDMDVEMEDDDGTDPTTKASHYKPGKWAKKLRKPSDECSDESSDSNSDSSSQSDDSDDSDQNMDMGGTGNVDGKNTSSSGPDTKVASGEEDISSESDGEGDDSDSDTISNPPSNFEEENPLEKKGEEDSEDESESGSEEEVSGGEMDEGGSVHGNNDMDEDRDDKSSSDSSDSDSSDDDDDDDDDAAEPAKGTTAGDEEGSGDDMDEDDPLDNGEEESEGDSESESASESEREGEDEHSSDDSDEDGGAEECGGMDKDHDDRTSSSSSDSDSSDDDDDEDGISNQFGGLSVSGEPSTSCSSTTPDSDAAAASDESTDTETSTDSDVALPPRPTPQPTLSTTTAGSSDASDITNQLRGISLGSNNPPSASTTAPDSSTTAESSHGPSLSTSTPTDKDISRDFSQMRRHPGGDSLSDDDEEL